LTSSLEDPGFGLKGIKYFNSIIQVGTIVRIYSPNSYLDHL